MNNFFTQPRRYTVLALVGYLGLAILMTWPAILRLSTEIVGGHDDLWIHQWTFWWIKEAIRYGRDIFYTDYLYYPDGVTLTSHNIAWFNIAVWLPLQMVVGQIPAYGLILITTFAVNGFALFLFARRVIKNEWAAFVGGVIFAFWPYTMSHNDHPNMIVLFWLPLSLLGLTNLVEKQRWRDVVITAAFIAMIGISRWQVLIMSIPLLILYLLLLMWRSWNRRTDKTGFDYWNTNKHLAGKLFSTVFLAGLLMAPLATPLLVYQFTREHPEDLAIDEPGENRTDILAYVTPLYTNSLWGDSFAAQYAEYESNMFYVPFIGFTTLLLALIGVFGQWRQTRFWLFIALLYLLFALGDYLTINGHIYSSIPLPFNWVKDTTIFQLIRRPHRLNLILSLPVAMIAGWGVNALTNWLQHSEGVKKHKFDSIIHKRGGLLLVLAIITLVLVEYTIIPFPTTSPDVPGFYQALADDSENFAVLDIPVNNHAFNKWYMFYQITHGKRIMTGHISRLPAEALDYMKSVPFLHTTVTNDSVIDPSQPDVTRQLDQLADTNVRYIVIHKMFANEGLIASWRDWMAVEPVHEDNEVVVYSTRPTVQPLSMMNSEIGYLEMGFSPSETVQNGTLRVNTVWASATVPTINYVVCYSLNNDGNQQVHRECNLLGNERPTSHWANNEIFRTSDLVQIPATIDPGDYELSVDLDNETKTTVLGSVLLQPYAPDKLANIRFGDDVTLSGYNVEQKGEDLSLTLYWQTDAPLGISYKFFVHMIDSASGQMISQIDAVPRNWTYPTTMWEPGEIVHETITLETDGRTDFELWLGLYDEESGLRLAPSIEYPERPGAIKLSTGIQ